MSDVVIRAYLSIGYPSVVQEDEIRVSRKDWDEMTQDQRDELVRDCEDALIENYVDTWHKIEGAGD